MLFMSHTLSMAGHIVLAALDSNYRVCFDSGLPINAIIKELTSTPRLDQTVIQVSTRTGTTHLLCAPLCVLQQRNSLSTGSLSASTASSPHFTAVPSRVLEWVTTHLSATEQLVWFWNLCKPMTSIRTGPVDLVQSSALNFHSRESFPFPFPSCLSIAPEPGSGYGVHFAPGDGVGVPTKVSTPFFGQLISSENFPFLHPSLRPRTLKLCSCDEDCDHSKMLVNSQCLASFVNTSKTSRGMTSVVIVSGDDPVTGQSSYHHSTSLISTFAHGTSYPASLIHLRSRFGVETLVLMLLRLLLLLLCDV